MMSFYGAIVKAYDEIFPLNKTQADLIENLLGNLSGKRILDCGCGTGNLAIELGRRSAFVEAFDLDKDMLQKAEEKCPQAINVKFREGNLETIDKDYSESTFDLVCCIGNTLAHLDDLGSVSSFLRQAEKLLKPGGHILIQIVNYDRVQSKHIVQLPTIESSHYIFERNYIHEPHDVIQFSTSLTVKDEEKVYTQSVPLISIQKQDLNTMMSEGFEELQFYGSFKKEEWNEDTFNTVVIAKKAPDKSVNREY